MKKEYSAGIILYYDDKDCNKKFLILKHNKGHWSFPKGHIEDNEDTKTAALREVEEETGINNIEILVFYEDGKEKEYLLEENYFIENTNVFKTNYYFIGKIKNEKDTAPFVRIADDEISEYKWCEYKEALALITFSNAKELLKTAYEIITKRN